jgi:hypothetical protein
VSTSTRASRSRLIATATSVRSPDEARDVATPASVISVIGRSSSATSVSGRAFSSATVRPATVTASAARVRPVPPQSEQGPDSTNCSTFVRWVSLCESARVCSTNWRALQKRPL